MTVAFCILACLFAFLAIAFVAVYVQIIRPMREQMTTLQTKQTEQEDTIARNAKASISLYMVNRREINMLAQSLYSQNQKLAFVESYVVPEPARALLSCDDAPSTAREIEPCPDTKRSNR